MYANVPPPGHQGGPATHTAPDEQERPSLPANIPLEQWERFQKLKDRRRDLCFKDRTQRVNTLRKKTLDTVDKELTEHDRELLAKEGLTLPVASRKRSRPRSHDHLVAAGSSSLENSSKPSGEVEKKWQELKRYLDPNPQLKGGPESTSIQKSGLEQALDRTVEGGNLEQAVAISDNIANREFASQIATAFDCVEYAKKQKMEKERKKRKPSKLKWSFEQKKRWETKGNM